MEVPTERRSYKAIVGLGNPGEEYGYTRHNLGFMVVDTIAGSHGASFHRECRSHLGSYSDGETDVILVKPITYMNNSGRAVRAVWEDYGPCDRIFAILPQAICCRKMKKNITLIMLFRSWN